jgi:anti-anti-sigma regulatory factor
MSDEPFTNRELKKYFDDFKNDLVEIKEDIQLSRRLDNERFLKLEADVLELRIKQENMFVKISGVVFIATAGVSVLINRLFS